MALFKLKGLYKIVLLVFFYDEAICSLNYPNQNLNSLLPVHKRSISDKLTSSELRQLLELLIRREESIAKPACKNAKYDVLHSQIIRTKDSLNNGAHFIDDADVNSASECQDKCCSSFDSSTHLTCNVAVFHLHPPAGKPNCFLFDCLNSSGSFSCSFSPNEEFTSFRNSLSKAVKSNSEMQELQAVTKNVQHFTTKTTISTTTAEKETTTSFPQTSAAVPIVHSEVSSTETLLLTTQSVNACSIGKCLRFEWQCDNNCCISFQRLCDGTAHCSDGSDEVGCPTHSVTKVEAATIPFEKPTSPSVTTSRYPQTTTPKVQISSKSTSPVMSVAKKKDKVNSNVEIKHANANTKTPAAAAELAKAEEEVAVVNSEATAVLPLAIGLAVTCCVLLMVACRVRTMKQKLRRRGKPLSMDESDYLINGMYL